MKKIQIEEVKVGTLIYDCGYKKFGIVHNINTGKLFPYEIFVINDFSIRNEMSTTICNWYEILVP